MKRQKKKNPPEAKLTNMRIGVVSLTKTRFATQLPLEDPPAAVSTTNPRRPPRRLSTLPRASTVNPKTLSPAPPPRGRRLRILPRRPRCQATLRRRYQLSGPSPSDPAAPRPQRRWERVWALASGPLRAVRQARKCRTHVGVSRRRMTAPTRRGATARRGPTVDTAATTAPAAWIARSRPGGQVATRDPRASS